MSALGHDGRTSTSWHAGLIVTGAGAVLIAGGWALYWFTPEQRGIRACDGAVQRMLVSPATYHRIGAETSDGTYFRITYDAENSYGVPIRGRAQCYFSGDEYASAIPDPVDELNRLTGN